MNPFGDLRLVPPGVSMFITYTHVACVIRHVDVGVRLAPRHTGPRSSAILIAEIVQRPAKQSSEQT